MEVQRVEKEPLDMDIAAPHWSYLSLGKVSCVNTVTNYVSS